MSNIIYTEFFREYNSLHIFIKNSRGSSDLMGLEKDEWMKNEKNYWKKSDSSEESLWYNQNLNESKMNDYSSF